MNGDAVNPDEFLEHIAADLDCVAAVPDDALSDLVTRDGACMALYRDDQVPDWTGDDVTDRQVAARICAGCGVRRHCLELELRTSGHDALGVWGALPADDIRAVYPIWLARRGEPGDGAGGEGA